MPQLFIKFTSQMLNKVQKAKEHKKCKPKPTGEHPSHCPAQSPNPVESQPHRAAHHHPVPSIPPPQPQAQTRALQGRPTPCSRQPPIARGKSGRESKAGATPPPPKRRLDHLVDKKYTYCLQHLNTKRFISAVTNTN